MGQPPRQSKLICLSYSNVPTEMGGPDGGRAGSLRVGAATHLDLVKWAFLDKLPVPNHPES